MHNTVIKKIAVLKGGWTSEREISLLSAANVANSARELGHDVVEIDVSKDLNDFVTQLTLAQPDLVLNMMHGKWGEDGHVQSILNWMQIPYTFSNHTSSALAMDKTLFRHVMLGAHIPIPVGKEEMICNLASQHPIMDFPFVMKPPCEGSSYGVSIIHNMEQYTHALEHWVFGERVLIEEYIPGTELSTLVIGNKAIGTIELRPRDGFYDYSNKYVNGLTDHIMPAAMPECAYQQTLEIAQLVAHAAKTEGICRVDFRYNKHDENHPLRVLELNTQPGMTSLSLVPEIAAHAGLSMHDLVQWMIGHAKCHA